MSSNNKFYQPLSDIKNNIDIDILHTNLLQSVSNIQKSSSSSNAFTNLKNWLQVRTEKMPAYSLAYNTDTKHQFQQLCAQEIPAIIEYLGTLNSNPLKMITELTELNEAIRVNMQVDQRDEGLNGQGAFSNNATAQLLERAKELEINLEAELFTTDDLSSFKESGLLDLLLNYMRSMLEAAKSNGFNDNPENAKSLYTSTSDSMQGGRAKQDRKAFHEQYQLAILVNKMYCFAKYLGSTVENPCSGNFETIINNLQQEVHKQCHAPALNVVPKRKPALEPLENHIIGATQLKQAKTQKRRARKLLPTNPKQTSRFTLFSKHCPTTRNPSLPHTPTTTTRTP